MRKNANSPSVHRVSLTRRRRIFESLMRCCELKQRTPGLWRKITQNRVTIITKHTIVPAVLLLHPIGRPPNGAIQEVQLQTSPRRATNFEVFQCQACFSYSSYRHKKQFLKISRCIHCVALWLRLRLWIGVGCVLLRCVASRCVLLFHGWFKLLRVFRVPKPLWPRLKAGASASDAGCCWWRHPDSKSSHLLNISNCSSLTQKKLLSSYPNHSPIFTSF